MCRDIQNDCRGFNNLPYTIHFRQQYMFYLFNRTTLQIFVTYLTGALYVHPLWFYKHQHDNRVRSKLFVTCQRWWFQWRFWFVPSVPGYLREEVEHKPDPWRNPIERNHMGLYLENEMAVVKTPTIISNDPVYVNFLHTQRLSLEFVVKYITTWDALACVPLMQHTWRGVNTCKLTNRVSCVRECFKEIIHFVDVIQRRWRDAAVLVSVTKRHILISFNSFLL